MTLKERILMDISEERERQVRLWGDDEATTVAAFTLFMRNYAREAMLCHNKHELKQARRELVKVGALAMAAIEKLDKAEMAAAESKTYTAAPAAGYEI